MKKDPYTNPCWFIITAERKWMQRLMTSDEVGG